MLYSRKMLAYAGPLLGILFIAWSTTNNTTGAEDWNFFNKVYVGVLIVLGFYQAANTLSEHKTADGRQSSLTVPASDTEKFISAWLYSGPIFLIVYTIAFFILSWIVTGTVGIFGIGGIPAFNPVEGNVLPHIKFFFLVAQPVGLLAAIAFDRYPAAKIVGSLLAVALGLGAIAALTVRIVYREAFEGIFTPVGNVQMNDTQLALNSDSPLVLLLLLGLTLLAATYFKFQEKSV